MKLKISFLKRIHLKGFTLLELIIVIIVTGVMAALAIPLLFKAIENSRNLESDNATRIIANSIKECRLMKGDLTAVCTANELIVDVANMAQGGHWDYQIQYGGNQNAPDPECGAVDFKVVATRNTTAGGDGVRQRALIKGANCRIIRDQ